MKDLETAIEISGETHRRLDRLNQEIRLLDGQTESKAMEADAVLARLAADGRNPLTDRDAFQEIDPIYKERDALAVQAERLRKEREELLGGIAARSSDPVTSDTTVLKHTQRMADWARVEGLVDRPLGLSFGRYIHGIVTGDWKGAEVEHALSEGTLGAGGYLVPTPLSLDIIDRARNATRVLQAGALTVPMETETLSIARVGGDPTANWKAENAPVTESDMTFERVQLRAKTLIALVRASREVVEDAVNLEEALSGAFVATLALELDRASLYGTGVAPQPTGVKNTTGITTQSMGVDGAAPTNYDFLVDAIINLQDRNHQASGIIDAPRTERTLAKLKDTTNQPLVPPDVVKEIRRYPTKQVPTNLTQGTSTDASDVFVADWTQLLIGMRAELTIEVLRERYAGDNFQVGFLAHLRADVQLAHPEAFTAITGVRP